MSFLQSLKEWVNEKSDDKPHPPLTAIYALIAIMQADGKVTDSEEKFLIEATKTLLNLDQEEALLLIKEAKEHYPQHDKFAVFNRLKREYTLEERTVLFNLMTGMMFADGKQLELEVDLIERAKAYLEV